MKKGFTLIELMIVVAIIGILAAVAIPKFVDLINKSKVSAYYERQIEANSHRKASLLKEREEAMAMIDSDRRASIGFVLENYTTKFRATKDSSRLDREAMAYSEYRLQDGNRVECHAVTIDNGMTSLSDCKDGRTYLSQTNVVKLN